jgi:hypothetical protein
MIRGRGIGTHGLVRVRLMGQRGRKRRTAIQAAKLLERVGDWQQWQLLRQRETTPVYGEHSTRGPAQTFIDEPGLSDTGVPDHQHEAHPSGQCRLQPGQFTLPTDEGPPVGH